MFCYLFDAVLLGLPVTDHSHLIVIPILIASRQVGCLLSQFLLEFHRYVIFHCFLVSRIACLYASQGFRHPPITCSATGAACRPANHAHRDAGGSKSPPSGVGPLKRKNRAPRQTASSATAASCLRDSGCGRWRSRITHTIQQQPQPQRTTAFM